MYETCSDVREIHELEMNTLFDMKSEVRQLLAKNKIMNA